MQKSVWVFQDLAPQRCPKNYSQERERQAFEADPKNKSIEEWKASNLSAELAEEAASRQNKSGDPDLL